jgi:hypothetical protein
VGGRIGKKHPPFIPSHGQLIVFLPDHTISCRQLPPSKLWVTQHACFDSVTELSIDGKEVLLHMQDISSRALFKQTQL